MVWDVIHFVWVLVTWLLLIPALVLLGILLIVIMSDQGRRDW